MGKFFSKRLKELRKDESLTQEVLAKELSLERYNISDWEQGRTEPDLETVVRIAVYFGVSTDYLLGLEK